MRDSSPSRLVSVCALLAWGGTLVAACGSEDIKKKSQPPKYQAGGDGNDSGGSSAKGDGGADGRGASNAVGGMTGDAGSGTTGDAGMTSSGGVGGAGTGDKCPAGYDDCDNDPTDCETPVNTLTQCGGCDITCSDTNGVVECQNSKCVMTSCTKGYGDCDQDGTTGCEESLAENDANCGECGRDCATAGSQCNTSMCDAIDLVAATSGFDTFMVGRTMYVMNSGAMPVSNYTLTQVALDGGSKKQIWAGGGNVGMGALWADNTDVYWAVSGTPPSVLKKAASAASGDNYTVVFQPDAQPHWLSAQGANFYWASNKYGGTGFIYARSKTAAMNVKGTAIMSVDQGQFYAFATTPKTAYWVASQGGPELRMMPLPAGGPPTPVPDAVVSSNPVLFVHGETLYFVRKVNSNALNGIYSYKAGDGTVKQLVPGDNIVAMIADDQAIYYKVGGDYRVFKAKLTGGAGVPFANKADGSPFAGQDDTFIYQVHVWGSSGDLQAIVK